MPEMDTEKKLALYKIKTITLTVIVVLLFILIELNIKLIAYNTNRLITKKGVDLNQYVDIAEKMGNKSPYTNHSGRELHYSYNNRGPYNGREWSGPYSRYRGSYKYQIVNEQGEPIVAQVFEFIGAFSPDLAPASVDGKWGYINKKGEWGIKPIFDRANSFMQDEAIVEIDGKQAKIDKNGKYIFKPKYKKIGRDEIGLLKVYDENNKVGLIDKNGKQIIPAKFDELGSFFVTGSDFDVRCLASIDGKWGMIDKKGNFVIPPQFDSIRPDKNNTFTVKLNGKYGIIDQSGKYILEPRFDEIMPSYGSKNIAVRVNDKWGYVDADWNYVIKPKFDFPLEYRGDIILKKIRVEGAPLVKYNRQEERFTEGAGISHRDNQQKARLSERDTFNLPKNFEVHVVSGYEPVNEAPKRIIAGINDNQSSKIIVDRPGKNVVLLLSSYDKITWKVSATPGTKIVRIITGGNNESYVETNKKIPVTKTRFPYADKLENILFKKIQEYVKNNLGKKRIDSFTGDYKIPEVVNISRIDSKNEKLSIDYPKAQKSPVKTSFTLINLNGKEVAISPEGPIKGSFYTPESMMVDKIGRYGFAIGNNALIVKDNKSDTSQNYPIPNNFPSFSHTSGIAYSPEENLVDIVSLGGEGYLYRFDLKNKKWKDCLSMNNVDLNSLVYDKYTNHFLGIASFREGIYELTTNGKVIRQYNIQEQLPGYLETFDSHRGCETPLSIVPLKDYIILLKFNTKSLYYGNLKSSGTVQMIWVLDRKTNKAVLTYKN